MIGDAVPIARSMGGAPLVYAAFGVALHLERLAPADGDRLAQACDLVRAWIGPRLRFTWSSVHPEVAAFDPAGGDLDLVASFPAQLRDTEGGGPASAMLAAHFDKFGVACHGGAQRNDASPWSFRFFATARPGDGELLRSDAMISVTVPMTTPLAELEAQAKALAAALRVRWGAAGFAYGAWEMDRYGDTRDAIYAHARRYPGFDVGQHATWMSEFHDRMRTVSWLTFVGPGLLDRVRASGASGAPGAAGGTGAALESDALVRVEAFGEGESAGVVLRAGERPQPGDVNRREVPRAYAEVDRRLRAVRASEGIHFYAPWSAATTEAWLRRFET
jgi:hypothetical protein